MKQYVCLALSVALVISVLFTAPMETTYANSEKATKSISFFTSPSMKSIKIKWKKKSGVSYFIIYRVDLKGAKLKTPALSSYKNVGKVSGKRKSWTDKKTRKGHYYGYVLRGYKSSRGKDPVLVYDSYMEGDCDYACANLDRAELLNGGDGEFFSNSKDVLYLYVQRDSGVRPDGVVIYRKAAGESKYKQIKSKKAEKGRFNHGKTYKDTTVKPGTTYFYKARTYRKYKGKRRYSAFSKPVQLSAVNMQGVFDVKSMTTPGTTGAFVVKLTSRKYNGALTILAGTGEGSPVYSVRTGSKTYEDQMVTLDGYSQDSKTWSRVPSTGLTIKAGESCYLRFSFSKGSGYFGGNTGVYSNVFMDNWVRYESCAGLAEADLILELVKGTGGANLEFD